MRQFGCVENLYQIHATLKSLINPTQQNLTYPTLTQLRLP